jgi:type IV pilus assembly protein PilC
MSSANVHDWRLHSFVVRRKAGRSATSAPVLPRRVLVLAPWAGAERLGVGLQRDEDLVEGVPGLFDRVFLGSRLPSGELADFFQAMGCALKAGQPLLGAFAMSARQARSPRMRGVIGALSHLVSQGVELHVAMERFPGVFDAAQCALAKAASKAGLDEAGSLFLDLSSGLQKDGKLGRKLAGALAYPLLLLCMALGAALILEIKALPPMVELFRAMGARLPPVTEAFYRVSRFLVEHGLILGPATVAALSCLGSALLRWSRSRSFQYFVVRTWVVGPIIRVRSLSRALGIFLLLRQCGSTTREMFLLAAEASGNAMIADYFKDTYRRVAAGESLEEAFMAERHQLGDDGVRLAGRMDVGMAGGDLKLLLRSLVEELNDQTELRLALLPKALELPMLALCGLIIGSIILAIFLPYPSLLGDAARQMRS